MHDRTEDTAKDYTRKRGIEHTAILTPSEAPAIAQDREQLWNGVEEYETRANAGLGKEIAIALPHELPADERAALAEDFASHLVEQHGVGVDLAVHQPNPGGDERNYHAHLMLTPRKIEADGFGDRSDLQKNPKTLRKEGKATDTIEQIRADWSEMVTQRLEAHGHAEAAAEQDHRSYERRGIERIPTKKEGAARAMERRGIKTDRGRENREIEERNSQLERYQAMRARIDRHVEEARDRVEERIQEMTAPEAFQDRLERMRQREGKQAGRDQSGPETNNPAPGD